MVEKENEFYIKVICDVSGSNVTNVDICQQNGACHRTNTPLINQQGEYQYKQTVAKRRVILINRHLSNLKCDTMKSMDTNLICKAQGTAADENTKDDQKLMVSEIKCKLGCHEMR